MLVGVFELLETPTKLYPPPSFPADPVIMRDCVVNCIDAAEISLIIGAVACRPWASSQVSLPSYGIQHGNGGQTHLTAVFL